MYGRLSQSTAVRKAEIIVSIVNQLDLEAQFDLAPSQPLAAVLSADSTLQRWGLLRWALIPHWAKDAKLAYKMITAKAETVAEKPAFRGPFRHRRRIIPADGFYEWRTEGKQKQPYFIRMKDESLMFFAGLWDTWHGEELTIESCTIITTSAKTLLQPLHHRMPAILTAEQCQRRGKYLVHYHAERHHQGKDNVLLFPTAPPALGRVDGPVGCKERLGRPLKYYHREAA